MSKTVDFIVDSLADGDMSSEEAVEAMNKLIIKAEAEGYKKGRDSVKLSYSHDEYDLQMQSVLQQSLKENKDE